MKFCSEKGSITVLSLSIVSIVLTSILLFTLLVERKVNKGIYQDSIVISARSILSEYNPYVMKNYGLFLLNKDSKYMSKAMNFYLKENISKRTKINSAVHRGEFSATIVENLQKAIVEHQKLFFSKKAFKNKENTASKRASYRTLRNKKIINKLASDYDRSSFDGIRELVDLIKNVDEIFDSTKTKVLVDDYILDKFNHFRKDNGETFYRHEIEYILSGSNSDEINYKRFRRKLKMVRNLVNIAIIETTPELKGKVTALAGATGPFAGFTYLGLLEAWALAEAENDVRILEEGGKIPIKKDEKTWAIDISNILSLGKGYVDNNAKTGMDYQDYLRTFLFMTSKEKKLGRLMDLIQINTQGNYDKDFTFSGSSFGIDFSIDIEGQVYEWKEKY